MYCMGTLVWDSLHTVTLCNHIDYLMTMCRPMCEKLGHMQVYKAPELTRLDIGEKYFGALQLRDYRSLSGHAEQHLPAFPIQMSDQLEKLTMLPVDCKRDLPYNSQCLSKLTLSNYSPASVPTIPLLTRFSSLRKLRLMSYNLQESDRDTILVPFCSLTR